jgi:hypothetical protein
VEYKVVIVPATAWSGTNFEKAAEELAEKVNLLLADRWQVQGGVAVGETQTTKEPFLFQALVRG